MVHNNQNVFDLDKSIEFYQDAFDMQEVKRINAKAGSFIIVYLEDCSSRLLKWMIAKQPTNATKKWESIS